MSRPEPSRRLPLRIVKLGGSLLDWPPMAERLNEWLAVQRRACAVLIAGGGDFTDAVYRAQLVHHFDDESAHWKCVRALSVTAALLGRMLPGVHVANSLDDVLEIAGSGASIVVFDPARFLEADEPHAPGQPLPHEWSATTDSIAARTANLLSAPELVLLKSADPPAGSLADLTAVGYVDSHFSVAAARIQTIRLVNLRCDRFRERTLVPDQPAGRASAS
jgi:dihydroneopterin aldolase